MLFPVRHGAPVIRPETPPHEWELDAAAYDAVWAPRTSALLHDGEIGVLAELREHERGVTPWFDDWHRVDPAGGRADGPAARPGPLGLPGDARCPRRGACLTDRPERRTVES